MTDTAVLQGIAVQRKPLLIAAGIAALLALYLAVEISLQKALLLGVGLLMGVSLYHAAFGFAGAYRKAFVNKEISGVTAQLIMLGAAMLLFGPILAQGQAFGHGVAGSVAPVSVSMIIGAFIFGIGMQLGGACASGTLFTAGGGSPRMMVVLVFFCIGAFWGSLDLRDWQQLPSAGAISLSREFGWEGALIIQLSALGLIYLGLRAWGARHEKPLWWGTRGFSWGQLVSGPWPLLLSAVMLALLNWATLLIAGHAWSITWAFSLWAAKIAVFFGWDPSTSSFWTGGFQERMLNLPIFYDTTSMMNVGIILGAFMAAALAGKLRPDLRMGALPLAAAVIGGLLMGYGARLAYGCNIGALFSGIASTSLHGWVWIVAALVGSWIGIKVRPLFKLG